LLKSARILNLRFAEVMVKMFIIVIKYYERQNKEKLRTLLKQILQE